MFRMAGGLCGVLFLFSAFRVSAALHDSVQVFCQVEATDSSIEVNAGALQWEGYWHEQRYRFNSSVVTCSFHAAGSGWKIQVYHTNGVENTPLSCVYHDPSNGTLRTNWIPVKVWQPSFGPEDFYARGEMPDPMDDEVYVLTPYVPCTLSREGWNSSPFRFHFMVDAQYAVEGTYSGTIFLELMYE